MTTRKHLDPVRQQQADELRAKIKLFKARNLFASATECRRKLRNLLKGTTK